MSTRRITTQSALNALRTAAGRLHVSPGDLTVPQYRALRGSAPVDQRPPSDVTISLLFGGWDRACDEASHASGGITLH